MAFIAKQRYKLDITPKGGWVVVYASQHDDGAREVEFEITNQGNAFSIPASINVSVQGIKSNKSYFSHSCSYSGNIVTMALADDMTDIVGKAICVLKFTNQSNQKLATAKFVLNVDTDSSSEGIIIDTEAEEIFNQMLNEIRAQASAISADIAELQSMVGSPLVASTASAMTNHNKIYVYTGSESGYTNGNWYYWNGSAWASGGVYNSTAFETDKTLSVENMAADAKAVGDEIDAIREPTRNLNNQAMGRWRAMASGAIEASNAHYFGMRDMVPCEPDTTYTVSFGNVVYSGTMHIYTTWYDSNRSIINQIDNTQGSSLSATNTSPSNAAYIYANLYQGQGITYTDDSWIQIEKGSVKTDHIVPYAPKGVPENTENISDILDALQYKAVMSRNIIPADSDINTYIQPGVYSVTSDDIATSLLNWPNARRGDLIVFNSRGSNQNYSYGKIQVAITHLADMFYRRFVSSYTGWSAWLKLAKDADLQDAVSEIKNAPPSFHLPSNPYKAVATKTDSVTGKKTWSDKIKDIKSTCHMHISLAAHFKKAVDKGYEHLAFSNYHASVPIVPIRDILPTLPGYDSSIHTVPDYWIESPNAEHVYFTGEVNQLHMNAIGSYLTTGSDNTGQGSGGFDGTTDDFFDLAMAHLKYANGGGVSINHPKWSGLTADKIIELYDKGAVFGLEIYNADCEYHKQNGYALELWDAVLSTGRQIFGLAVPDHSAESSSNPDWATWPWGYNHMLCRTTDEVEILLAYRNGRFYTTIDNDNLSLEYFGLDNGVATIRTSEAGTITFTTKTRTVVTENSTEASITLTSGDVYVRASCETATNKLFTNAIML